MDNQTRYRRILATLCGQPWAIMQNRLSNMIDVFMFLRDGGVLSAEEIEARIGGGRKRKPVSGSVTVLPLVGVMEHRPSMMSEFFGWTSTEVFGRWFDAAANDESVGAIVMDIDTPGGAAAGLEELSAKIFKARRPGRPIIAVVNDLAASAGYYAATPADEIVMTPGSLAGSVGTIAIHIDFSKALEQEGITPTIISAGENKSAANSLEPLSDTGRKQIQDLVDEYYEQFVADVAKNRGVKKSVVKSAFGQGLVFGDREAVARGMADRIATLNEVLAGLGVKRSTSRSGPRSEVGAGRSVDTLRRRTKQRARDSS